MLGNQIRTKACAVMEGKWTHRTASSKSGNIAWRGVDAKVTWRCRVRSPAGACWDWGCGEGDDLVSASGVVGALGADGGDAGVTPTDSTVGGSLITASKPGGASAGVSDVVTDAPVALGGS
jgi:hypothetical protein